MKNINICFLLYFSLSLNINAQQITNEYFTNFNNRVIDKSATCDRNFIYFNIVFSKPFFGLIYTDGTYGSNKCTYVNGTILSRLSYNITIPLTECRSKTLSNGTSQNVVVVQRDTRILEASDNLYMIACNPIGLTVNGNGNGGGQSSLTNGGGRDHFTLSFAGITVHGTLASTELVTNAFVDNGGSPIDYTAEVQFGQGPFARRLDRPLGVGEAISYVVKIRRLRSGIDARIGRCWATDGLQQTSQTEIQLSDDEGCSVLPGTNIWNNFKTAPSTNADEKILFNDIKAWAFPTSNRVNIFCNLHLCQTGQQCPTSNCRSAGILNRDEINDNNNNRTGSNRRRRTMEFVDIDQQDAEILARIESGYAISLERRFLRDDAYDEEKRARNLNLNSSFILVTSADHYANDQNKDDHFSAQISKENNNNQNKVCLTHTNFVVGVVLLLIIISLSFLFIIVLLYKTSAAGRRRRRRSAQKSSGGREFLNIFNYNEQRRRFRSFFRRIFFSTENNFSSSEQNSTNGGGSTITDENNRHRSVV